MNTETAPIANLAPAPEPAVAPVSAPIFSDTAEKVCPHCNTANPPAFKFCGGCGQPLPKLPNITLITMDLLGQEGIAYRITQEETVIGRTCGEILLSADRHVSPAHAHLFLKDKKELWVEDLGTLNGTYYRLGDKSELRLGSRIRLGRQTLRLESPADLERIEVPPAEEGTVPLGCPWAEAKARLTRIFEGGALGEAFLLFGTTALGRTDAEITFPDDTYVSNRHAAFHFDGDVPMLEDCQSSNGTFLELHAPRKLNSGDMLLIGNVVLKIKIE